MFSKAYYNEIKQYFDRKMALLNDRSAELEKKEAEMPDVDKSLYHYSRMLLEQKIEEIKGVLAGCACDQAEALQFLYSAMPLSDLLDYPASLYLAYAEHGVRLWKDGPFAGKVPEKIFANYVLHYRVHNEDIADTRKFFHDELIGRIAGKNMYDAAVETNYWCAEKATYRTTFMRTQNPLTMYKTAIGRCGEEAPFAVTALRSLGIPAREVAASWWSHCDDNHAWVEAWCDGSWHFLGACEPEESLDKGWFIGPASRAMLIDSAWFGQDAPLESVAEQPDMSVRLNHLASYAETVELTVRVEDEEGKPVPGARVEFAVLNYGRFNRVAQLYAGNEAEEGFGTVKLDTGYGDLLVCAYADGRFGERLVSLVDAGGETDGKAGGGDTKPKAEYVIVIGEKMQNLGQWRDLDFHAPKQTPRNERKTDEQFAAVQVCLEKAANCRQQRTADFYRTEEAERVAAHFDEEDREAVKEILKKARGNMGEIVRFLEWDFAGRTAELEKLYGQEHWKLEALRTLHENDYWDIRAEVLAECCICASPYAPMFPQDVFFPFLLNPCAAFELPRTGRAALLEVLGDELKEQIRNSPECLPGKLDRLTVSSSKQEYANLVVSPMGCLTGGIGNGISRMVLCINIYRALGIPARPRPFDRTMEYYKDGRFMSVAAGETIGFGKVILHMQEPLGLRDWKHYSLSRFENGHFIPLFLRPRPPKPEGESGEAEGKEDRFPSGGFPEGRTWQELEQGMYRVVTTNRLPNGNQFAKVYDFSLQEDEVKEITLSMRDIPVEAMLDRVAVSDFALHTPQGEEVRLSSLGKGKRALMLWLELIREPTEHILNELYEKRDAYAGLASSVYFVVKAGADYKSNATLAKTLEALPGVQVLTDEFGEKYEALACQVRKNPGILPLAVVLEEGGCCVHSDSGYNVGMADTLLLFLESHQE